MHDKQVAEALKKLLEFDKSSTEGTVIFMNGPWGSGKTYFWKNTLQQSLEKNNCLYVSLFGVQSVSDVREKLLAAILAGEQTNGIFSKVRSYFSKLNVSQNLSSVLEKWSGLPLKFDVLELDWARYVVCFDDLERIPSHASIEEILGFINYLSEHKKYRCLVVLNENEMKPEIKSDFLRLREKLSLRTFQLPFNLEDRLNAFIEAKAQSFKIKISSKERDLLKKSLQMVETDNLRTVRFVLDCYLQLKSDLKMELEAQDLKFLVSIIHHEANGHKENWEFYNFNPMEISFREYSRKRENPNLGPDEQTKFYEKYYEANSPYSSRRCIFDLIRTGYYDIQKAKVELFPEKEKLTPSETLAQEIKNTHFFFSEDSDLKDLIKKIEHSFENEKDLSFETIFIFLKGYSSASRLLEITDVNTLPLGFRELAERSIRKTENPLSYSSDVNFLGRDFLKIFIDALVDICGREDQRRRQELVDKALNEGNSDALKNQALENTTFLEKAFTSGQVNKIWVESKLQNEERYRILETIIKAMLLNSHNNEQIKKELEATHNHFLNIYNTSNEKMMRLRTYRLLEASGIPVTADPPASLHRG